MLTLLLGISWPSSAKILAKYVLFLSDGAKEIQCAELLNVYVVPLKKSYCCFSVFTAKNPHVTSLVKYRYGVMQGL